MYPRCLHLRNDCLSEMDIIYAPIAAINPVIVKLNVPNNVAMPITLSCFISMYWLLQNTASDDKIIAMRMLTPHVIKFIFSIVWLVSIFSVNLLFYGDFLFLSRSRVSQ